MHGAREAIAAGLSHIEEQVKAIEQAVDQNPAFAFDLAKAIVEGVCRTILTERCVSFDRTDDLPKLFRVVARQVPLLPQWAANESEAQRSLSQTLNGLSTALHGVCELRNNCGFVSHGSDAPRPAMEAVQALLAAETADAIVGFLHRVHRHDQVLPASRALKYEDNLAFNESIDEMYERVLIFGEEFEPSRVLFEMANEAYRINLAEFQPEPATDNSQSSRTGSTEHSP